MKKIFLTLAAIMVVSCLHAQYINIYKSENLDTISDPDSICMYVGMSGAQTIEIYKGKDEGNMPKLIYAEDDIDSITFRTHIFPTGTAATTTGDRQPWVQLWDGGPRWAAFNIGATITTYGDATPNEYAGYAKCGGWYSFGDSESAKFNPDTIAAKLEGDNDTATKLWGQNWRMPTPDEWQGLLDNCDWVWCDGTMSMYCEGCKVVGYKVKGRGEYADYSIFLPACGYYELLGWLAGGNYGFYWSSVSPKDPTYDPNPNARALYFFNGQKELYNLFRKYAYSVRAVLK